MKSMQWSPVSGLLSMMLLGSICNLLSSCGQYQERVAACAFEERGCGSDYQRRRREEKEGSGKTPAPAPIPGPRGEAGPAGERGPAGKDGAPSTVPGPVGAPGETGPMGPVGQAGAPGTSVSVVQFCPSRGPASYPTSFPEVGLCIGNKLYATYWDGHQAWTAEIPAGNYSSTATGLGCSFSVGSSCSITEY